MSYNKYISQLKPSKSIVFMDKAKQLKAKDPSVISLAGGEPDFDTPQRIKDELFNQINQNFTHYTVGPGLPDLRKKIAKKLSEENGCNYLPEGIIVTPGGKFAIYLAVRSFVNEGDEVMYLEPGWVSYPSIIEASCAVPVPVRLAESNGFRITEELLEKHYSSKTKMLIINYPNNPTGKILTSEESNIIKRFMLRHPDLLVLSDEIYERIVYKDFKTISLASFPEIANRVLTVNGFSKSVAMTGWRIGYVASEPSLQKIMNKLFQHTLTCVSGFVQKAAIVALDCSEEIEEMRKRYEARRDTFISGLNAINGVSCEYPEGAFYAWVKFDIKGMNSEQVCEYILNEAKVVGVPGIAYGTDDPFVRFSFAASDDDLKEAVKRIKKAVDALN